MIRHLRATMFAFLAGLAALGGSIAAQAASTTSYQIMVETRTDGTAPFEVYLASFASLADVFSGTTSAPTDFTDLAISPDYQIAGLTWDGSAYRALVQTRNDGTAPFEVYLASFASLDDVFSGTTSAPTDFTDLAISPDYQIADFTWDGSAYRMLVETRADGTAPFEVYLASFATLDDLFSGITSGPTDFTQIAISPDYQIAGFSSVTTTIMDPPPSVPEPTTWAMMLAGFAMVGSTMRGRRTIRIAIA